MMPVFLKIAMLTWIVEFMACWGGPAVMYERGDLCTRHNLTSNQWALTGQTVDLADYAVMQNGLCIYPSGCRTWHSQRN